MPELLYCKTLKDKAIVLAIAAVVSCVLAVGIGYASFLVSGPVSSGTWYNKYLIMFIAAVLLTVGIFFVFRYELKDKPERAFFAVLLVFTMGSSVMYDVNKVSWDVESHFRFMLQWTDPDGQVEISGSEYDGMYGYAARVETSIADLNSWKAWLNEQDTIDTGEVLNNSFTSFYNRLASLPGSLVYMITSVIGLPFAIKYVLTKLIYSVIFSVVCFLGMRQLNSGKMIFAAIAMIPSVLFMASNYSYDYWLICFLLYAVARLVGELQRPEEKLTLKSSLLIFGAFFIGCAPKAVYFPMAALALLMPRQKFNTAAQSRLFRAACFVVPVLIASSFLLNFVGSVSEGTNVGDSRAGSKINSTEQAYFILSDIPGYVLIVINFLLSSYLYAAVHDTAFLAYLNYPELRTWIVTAFILAFVMLTNKESIDKKYLCTWKTRTWSIVIAVITLGLVITSMYVSFTAVGSSSIGGVQPRYAIPILIAFLFFMGSPKLGEIIYVKHKAIYNTAILGLLTIIPYVILWQTYVSLLH